MPYFGGFRDIIYRKTEFSIRKSNDFIRFCTVLIYSPKKPGWTDENVFFFDCDSVEYIFHMTSLTWTTGTKRKDDK